MKHHGPIIKTVGAALAAFLAVALAEKDAASALLSSWGLLYVALGLLYTHAFEYWWHRVPMHRGLTRLADFRRSHLEHHRVFSDENFQTRDAHSMRFIAGRPWAFPLLLGVHYLVLTPFAAELRLGFVLGATLSYLGFEICHWATHVTDHALDRFLVRIPFLARVRAGQIDHHRRHHEVPVSAFNFSPPYLLDRLTGRMPDARSPVPAAAVPTPPPAPLSVELPPSRPWLRPLMRYGAAAAVVSIAVVGGVVLAKNARNPGATIAPTDRKV